MGLSHTPEPNYSTSPTPPRRPPRTLTEEAHERELARFRGPSGVRLRCEVDHEHTCHERGWLKPIGHSNADGVIQPLYQCEVCHAIWTEEQAFR